MKKFLTMAILAVAMVSGNAHANDLVQGYVTNSYGEVWKNSYGECWRDEYVATTEKKVECGYPVVCPEKLVISNINFAFDSDIISDSGYNSLITSKDLLNRAVPESCAIKSIEIVGHTDSIGTDEYNFALSIDRAEILLYPARPLLKVSVSLTRSFYLSKQISFKPFFKVLARNTGLHST